MGFGGKDFTKNISDEELEEARASMDSKLNPPEYAPGMEDDGMDFSFDDDEGDLFGDSGFDDFGGDSGGFADLGGFDSFGGGFDSGFGGGFGGDFGGGFGGPAQQPEEKPEDVFWETIVKGGKGSFNFIKEFVVSLKDFDTLRKKNMGRNSIFTGVGMVAIGLIGGLMGYTRMYNYMISGLIVMGVGVPIFMFGMSELQEHGAKPSGGYTPEDEWSMGVDLEKEPEMDFSMGTEEEDDLFGPVDTEEEDLFGGLFGDEEETDIFADNGLNWDEVEEEEEEEIEEITKETLEEKAENFNANMGMVTRSYLYETLTSVMEYKTPDFNKTVELEQDSKEFIAFFAMVENAAEQVKTGKSEEMPYLVRAIDKLFYTQLEVKRVKWMKNIQPFIDEIVNICSYDTETNRVDESVVGYGHAVGDKIYIKILKGNTAMITVKDTYKQVEADILDTDNYMPVVFGVDEEGEVILQDLKSINTMLVTGMPRSGKSWFMKTTLAQMMSFRGPSEVEFYLLDPKGAISDFRAMECMPHVKTFVSKDEEILQVLRRVTTVEADRRRQILADAGGYIDFWDLKKEKPEIELPLLYVVIDEVVTLSERMDKETKKEFQSLLAQLVSQLPALGIRVFMVPHVVKHDVIKKTITDLIPCRISVCGDAGHIESTTGATARDFPYKLVNKGDMAVRMNNDKTRFSHGPVLATSNDAMDNHFQFLAAIWNKVEPPKKEEEKKNKEYVGKRPSTKVRIEKEEEQEGSIDVSDLLKEAHDEIDLW